MLDANKGFKNCKSMLCAPLRVAPGSRVLGVLQVINKVPRMGGYVKLSAPRVPFLSREGSVMLVLSSDVELSQETYDHLEPFRHFWACTILEMSDVQAHEADYLFVTSFSVYPSECSC